MLTLERLLASIEADGKKMVVTVEFVDNHGCKIEPPRVIIGGGPEDTRLKGVDFHYGEPRTR